MNLLSRLVASNFFKGLIFFKVCLIVGVYFSLRGKVSFGELITQAADQPAKVNEEVLANVKPDADGYVDGDKKKTKRRSFLDELFELPTLDTENLKKDEIGRYLTIVERKTRQVEERITLLKDRETKLIQIEKAIDDKLRRLDEERRFFADSLQQEKNLKGERTASLVELYSKMAPKKAAPIVEKLNKDLVVELMKALPPKQVTAILEGMPPEKSVEISEYFGRLRSGREYDILKELNQSLKDEFQDCKGMPAQTAAPSLSANP